MDLLSSNATENRNVHGWKESEIKPPFPMFLSLHTERGHYSTSAAILMQKVPKMAQSTLQQSSAWASITLQPVEVNGGAIRLQSYFSPPEQFFTKETLQTDRPDQLLGHISALASPSLAGFEEWFQKTSLSIHLPCVYSTPQKAGDRGVSPK